MPIYEFYCADCHMIFNFRAHGFAEPSHPDCPKCGKAKIEKQISLFAISKGRGERDESDEGLPDLDESAMEKAMSALEGEASSLDENDPRSMAKFMRKLYQSTGLRLGDGMEEAIRRMESGEDPDKIEEEMGGLLDSDDLMMEGSKKINLNAIRRKLSPPRVDPKLHELEG